MVKFNRKMLEEDRARVKSVIWYGTGLKSESELNVSANVASFCERILWSGGVKEHHDFFEVVRDHPKVAEILEAFSHDSTADNAALLVKAVLEVAPTLPPYRQEENQ